jgi:hypothetical protein
MEEVLDARKRAALSVILGDSEQRLGEIAGDGLDPVAGPPALAQRIELLLRLLAHKDVDVPLALEEALDEMTPDETGRSRHEVAHPVSPSAVWSGVGIYPVPGPSQRTRTVTRLE